MSLRAHSWGCYSRDADADNSFASPTLAPNGVVGNRSWLIAKDLPIPVENRPSHRQFSGEVPPGAYSNACPVRGRPPCRAIANARVLIPRAQGGSGGPARTRHRR